MTTVVAGQVTRKRYRGLQQILLFNWHYYAAAAVLISLGVPLSLAAPAPWDLILGVCLSIAALWVASSLIVSHYVYDRSGLYGWAWLARMVPFSPRRWVNIHAGLDESSDALERIFRTARGEALDIFHPAEMSEASIHRARRHASGSARRADFRALPLPDGQTDAIFLIFAAHELRRSVVRDQFFRELQRVLRPGGFIMLVEHLRDLPNFLAYGPGCLHFLPRGEWLRAAADSGLTVENETRHTPFVTAFLMRKRTDSRPQPQNERIKG